ncbi:MAG: hypothetical protein ATN36_05865 [Epulopiscium sp. Nele67-Bin005]|nr:MAG: hypothetical protein ATN36_05865 [Epulopiscium sp. Nele67-Bin005]
MINIETSHAKTVFSQNVPYIIFKMWEHNNELVHAFSTREGGVSSGDCATLNFAFSRGDSPEVVRENYAIMANALKVNKESFVASKQVHETKIERVTYEDKGNGVYLPNKWESADGIYTTEKNLTLVTYYADCVPLFFYAPKYELIGMAHSGWKGTVGEIGKKMATIWHEQHGVPYEEIQVGIGPSIGKCCFEVHFDVAEVFLNTFGKADFITYNKEIDKYNIDLWECCKQSLKSLGIKQIEMADMCTCCNDDIFHSHRKTQGKRGTLSAFMCLRKED